MISFKDSVCPDCDGQLKYYDKVPRISITKGRAVSYISLRRLQCIRCKTIHREMTDDVFPFKHYEAEIIHGVLEGFITPDTLGFEDYPCEMTMGRWKSHLCCFNKQ